MRQASIHSSTNDQSDSHAPQCRVEGIIPRVYPTDPRQIAWRECWQCTSVVMVNIGELETLRAQGYAPREVLGPEQELIVCGAARNEHVANRTIAETVQQLRPLAPVTYVPDAGAVYPTDRDTGADGSVAAYIERLYKLHDIVEALDERINILPLIKALTDSHLDQFAAVFSELGYETVAYWAVEYTGGASGNALQALLDDTDHAIAAIDPEAVIVIGRGAPADLTQFPPRVRAACSFNQWFDRLLKGGDQHDVFAWHHAANEALTSGCERQLRLDDFRSSVKEGVQ